MSKIKARREKELDNVKSEVNMTNSRLDSKEKKIDRRYMHESMDLESSVSHEGKGAFWRNSNDLFPEKT